MYAKLPWLSVLMLEVISLSMGWPFAHLWALILACLIGWFAYPKSSTQIGLAAILALIVFGYLPIYNTYQIVTGHVIALLFVGSCFSCLMVKHQVHEVISTNMLAYASPKTESALTIVVMLIAAFLSMWISNTSAVVMLIPVVLAAAKKIDGSPEAMLLASAYGATIGGMLTPIGTPSNLVAIDYAERFFGLQISFAQWFFGVLPFVTSLLIVFSAYLSMTNRKAISFKQDVVEVKRYQQMVIKAIGFSVLLWATKTLPFGGWQSLLSFQVSEELIGFMALVACYFVKTSSEERLWSVNDFSKIGYGSIVMVMTGLCFAQAVKLSGAIEILSEALLHASFSSSSWVFIVATMVSMMTELCSNTAVTALSLTMTEMMMNMSHLSVLPCILMITLSANSAFMLPTATPPNAMILGTGKIKLSRVIGLGALMSLCSVVLLFLLYA